MIPLSGSLHPHTLLCLAESCREVYSKLTRLEVSVKTLAKQGVARTMKWQGNARHWVSIYIMITESLTDSKQIFADQKRAVTV